MHAQMTDDEYRTARIQSRITNNDIWYVALGITKDQDKSYSSGRTVIPMTVSIKIMNIVDKVKKASVELSTKLKEFMPKESKVEKDDETLNISIIFPTGKTLLLRCGGIDMLNLAPVYIAEDSKRSETVFLYMVCPWNRKEGQDHKNNQEWFLWRGDFKENRNLRVFQNYWNQITADLLNEAFYRYA